MNAVRKIYFGLNRVSNVLCKMMEILIVILVAVNAADVFLQVFNRYILVKISDLSFSWTDELARYSMIWICYCTIGICFREGSMAQVDILFGRLGKKGKLALYLVTRLLMLAVLVVAVKYGLYICRIKLIYRTAMLHAPGAVLYSAPVVGSLLLGFELLTEFTGVLCGELEPFAAGEKRAFPNHNEPEDALKTAPDSGGPTKEA